MASSIVSGPFQPQLNSVHLAARHSLPSSSYSATSNMSTTQTHAPFEGIVDFSYHQPHFGQYSAPPSDQTLHHQHSRSDTSADWKQSSFFSYRPNEVKHRKRTTRQQLKVLEETFRTTQKPDGNVRKALAVQLNMTPRNVQVWFQNRRAKDKTLAKRALKTVDEGKTLESTRSMSPVDHESETVGSSIENYTSPVPHQHAFVYPSSDSYSPPAAPSSEQDFRARYNSSVDTHSGSTSPIETVFPTQYDVATPVYAINGVVSPASSSFSQSDIQAPAYRASQYPATYTRDMFAPRASLPHIHATAFPPDSQHQRSASSPNFPSNVDTSSNLSLTTYASINGMLYPQQQQQQRFINAQPLYAGVQRTGPLPAADFTFGMPARSMSGDAEAEIEVSGYAPYSQFGSVSGSDTPSSHSGLSHYGSVASLTDSSRSFDEEGVPLGWKSEQRRGSIPLGVPRSSFAPLAARGFSPLSVGYSSNSPCPATEPESDNSESALYLNGRGDWAASQANECKPITKREDIESNQALGYQQGPYMFNGLVNQDATSENYQQYMAYGQQQQAASSNMLGYNFGQSEMSEIQMPRPTAPVAYGTYSFA
jgi:hypothetical protein